MSRGIDVLGALTRIVPERPALPLDGRSLRHVLLIKLSSIGDVVHALPAAVALKRSYPSLRLTWAVEEWTAPLVRDHAAVDRVVIFPQMMRWPTDARGWLRDFRRAIDDLRREPYDLALDLQGLAKSALISVLSRARVRWARAGQREGAHLVSRAVPLPRAGSHAVAEYLQLARELGADIGSVDFHVRPSREAAMRMGERLASHGIECHSPLVVMTPSAAQSWKDWPIDRWARVAEAVPQRASVVVAGTASQRQRHATLVGATCRPIVDLTGETTLADLVALLSRATVHVTPDSGPAHISAALGVPVVSLFGPTSPARLGPFGQAERVIEHRALCGRSCAVACRRHARCLEAIGEDEVSGAILQTLAQAAVIGPQDGTSVRAASPR